MADTPVFSTQRAQIAISRVGELSMFVAAAKIDDDEWSEWIDLGARYVAEFGPVVIGLNYSNGTGPSSKQRASLAARKDDLQFDKVKRQVLLTDSVLLRGAITALGWLLRTPVEQRAMASRDISKALTWLGEIGQFDRERALLRMSEMSARVGLPVPGQ